MEGYIQKDGLLARCRELSRIEINGEGKAFSIISDYDQFKEVINKLPLADVIPRRMGTWEFGTQCIPGKYKKGIAGCTECGYVVTLDQWPFERPPRYCPNCGAEMEEEE